MPFGIRLVPADHGFPDRNDCKRNFLPDGAPLTTLITGEEKEPWSILVRGGFPAVALGRKKKKFEYEYEYELEYDF
jgi:hypothetical protein